jgi:hypothetical protein
MTAPAVPGRAASHSHCLEAVVSLCPFTKV